MASIQLYGKTLEIPDRNNKLVERLRELLEWAEDGRLLTMSMVGLLNDDTFHAEIIESEGLTVSGLGAITLLQGTYQMAMLSDDDDEEDD